jgi:hypothetical protein
MPAKEAIKSINLEAQPLSACGERVGEDLQSKLKVTGGGSGEFNDLKIGPDVEPHPRGSYLLPYSCPRFLGVLVKLKIASVHRQERPHSSLFRILR